MDGDSNEIGHFEDANTSEESLISASTKSSTLYPELNSNYSDLENSMSAVYKESNTTKYRDMKNRKHRYMEEANQFIETELGNNRSQTEGWDQSPDSTHLKYESRFRGTHRSPNSHGYPEPLTQLSPSMSVHPHTGAARRKPIKFDWQWFFITLAVIIFLMLCAYSAGTLTWWSFAMSGSFSSKPVECTEFTELRKEYPHQSDKLFAFIKSGVQSTAYKKKKPSIFMLVHESGVNIKPLLHKLVKATQKCLGTEAHSPLHISPATLKKAEFLEDYGRVIGEYKSALTTSAIMVIENFDEVPPSVAQAFHVICDGENPYVARSVIYLTISVKEIGPKDNAYKVAEKHLTELWTSSLKSNVLGPLLYRVTDVSLFINRDM